MRMTEKKVAVIAVGGNSLIKDKAHQTIADQYNAAQESIAHIVDMIEAGWDVVITHGNGPQVGFILRRSELSAHELHEVPLDYCGADSQGAIGYMFERALYREMVERGMDKTAAAIVTQTVVGKDDPAFANPSKPIGTFMEEAAAKERAENDGWVVVEDAGRGWRRVVPSPKPLDIIEAPAIKTLINAGIIVVAVGGGGIPVVINDEGTLSGIEAVIDKDFSSSLLATEIDADLFVISTAVEKVSLNFNTPEQIDLDKITVAEAKQYIKDGQFAKGSMLPKVEAIIKFLENGGKQALITDPPSIGSALRGETGTWIVP
ncbi:MAG: carbamate kinase [Anaerolineaceae bacterium]|nr:carbamate kinase [Anaerolineaceae bacterium]